MMLGLALDFGIWYHFWRDHMGCLIESGSAAYKASTLSFVLWLPSLNFVYFILKYAIIYRGIWIILDNFLAFGERRWYSQNVTELMTFLEFLLVVLFPALKKLSAKVSALTIAGRNKSPHLAG